MAEDVTKISDPVIIETISEQVRNDKIIELSNCLKNKLNKPDLTFIEISRDFLSDLKTLVEVDGLIKRFADSKYSYLGTTSKDNKHSHDYIVMALNWGSELIGMTIGINGNVDNHIHAIHLTLDSKVLSLSAYTNLGGIKNADTGMIDNMHNHTFDSSIADITKDIPVISTNNKYYTEKQIEIKNERQAEIMVIGLTNIEDIDKQEQRFNEIKSKYPALKVYENDNSVAEMIINLAARKLDPKAKLRNRGDVVFPAESSDVKDKKDHFPINSRNQAQDALSRCSAYKSSPPWYKGTLAALQQKIRRAVHKKYPNMKIEKLTEFIALRFKDGTNVFFKFLETLNYEAAKRDALIYFNSSGNINVDVVKFISKEDGESKFEEIGSMLFYEVGNHLFSDNTEYDLSSMNNGQLKIEMLREGNYHHEIYGDFSVTEDTIDSIIKNFKDNVVQREISFDYSHLPELPAAAWVKNLGKTKRDINGMKTVLIGLVEPTVRGIESLKNKEFKYFSSEYTDNFIDRETGKTFGPTLKGGGLTNRPWIPGLAPITLSEIKEKVWFVTKNNQ